MKKQCLIDVLTDKYPEYDLKELELLIFLSKIKVNGETISNKKRMIDPQADILILNKKYVSRGGEKLEHAIKAWDIEIEKKIIIDAGSSTGGFTDCLLQCGAGKVYSIDVGYNQLDYKLRVNSKVSVFEKTNIMNFTREMMDEAADLAVMDLSFRSIKGAAIHVLSLVKEKKAIALIKPQFEYQDESSDFNGVIADKETLEKVLEKTVYNLEEEKVYIEDILESPIKGRKGNREFLFMLSLNKTKNTEELLKQIKSIL